MSFEQFCKQSQALWKKGKESAAQFGQDVPAGTYIGKLTKLALHESSNGNWMVQRGVTITEGEYRGSVARDNMNMGNEVGMGILIQFIEKHDVTPPEVLSEKALQKALDEILEQDPAYRFRLTFKNDFPKITILDIGADSDGAADDSGSTDAGDSQGSEAKPEQELDAEGDKEAFAGLVDFCKRQGIEVTKKDSLDSLKEKVSEYKFPAEGVTKQQLVDDEGFDEADVGDDIEFLTAEDVELLANLGLGETIIQPKKKAAPPAKKPLGKKK